MNTYERVDVIQSLIEIRAALAATLKERDEARAEIGRLEALFQQTHGVHHGWVERATQTHKAEMERDALRAALAKEIESREGWEIMAKAGHKALMRLAALERVAEAARAPLTVRWEWMEAALAALDALPAEPRAAMPAAGPAAKEEQ
jgi:regulator of protease activity HflC (stomatin/prohibitin superfamily)